MTTNENPSQMKSFDEEIAATAPTIVVYTTAEKWQKNEREMKKKHYVNLYSWLLNDL